MKHWITSRQAILATPLPQHGGKYAVIPHSLFLNEIQDKLKERGYDIADEHYLTTWNKQVMAGVFRIKDNNTELAPSISFINSYNKTKKASIRAGAIVLVCRNGMIGTIEHGSYSRKHTGTALEDFREHVELVIDGLQKEFLRLQLNSTEMKAIVLDNMLIGNLIGDMIMNEQLINPTQLSIFKKERKHSINFGGNTLWDFYNNCTEAFKDTNPALYDKQHVKFHTYICDKFQLTGSRGLFPALSQFQKQLEEI